MKQLQFIVIAVVLFAFCIKPGVAAIYKYVDKNGTPCFADNLYSIPEKYRKDAVLVSGKPEGADGQLSGKEIKSGAPDETKNEKEAFFSMKKAKEFGGTLFGNKVFTSVAALAAFIVVFAVIGKLGESLNRKWVSSVLRLVLTAGVLVYLFNTYSGELGRVFSLGKQLKEDVLGIKGQSEERNKMMETIGTEPPQNTKSQQ